MSKVKYIVRENTWVGTHSFYADPVINGSLEFEDVCEEACQYTSIEPEVMRAAVNLYMKAVKLNVLRSFRVAVGEHFLFVYPNLVASVKDQKDNAGNVVKAVTENDFTLASAKSLLGASVSPKFSQQFAREVSWQRVTASGTPVPDDEA